MDHLTAETVTRLMRAHRRTIRGLAEGMQVSQARIRYVRLHGVRGRAYVMDWMQALTGDAGAGWDVVAAVYLRP